jgi:formamidopyrimidine-DNA glycosylase
MPELPEVEVLARHLAPLVCGRTIRAVDVRRAKVVEPSTPRALSRRLVGATFAGLERRGKYLLFRLRPRRGEPFAVLGHLGMTGRMFLQPARAPLPKHAAVVLDLGRLRFVYEDPRYFGRFTLDLTALDALGPEPLGEEFTVERFAAALARSAQAIKIKLLDQSLVAGVGNIYASEALFRAGLSPRRAACRLRRDEVGLLHAAIRAVLAEAIACGSTIPLDFAGGRTGDRLFYFGRAADASDYHTERLLVYDRAGRPCSDCATPIRRIVQAARSTYFCPRCQK